MSRFDVRPHDDLTPYRQQFEKEFAEINVNIQKLRCENEVLAEGIGIDEKAIEIVTKEIDDIAFIIKGVEEEIIEARISLEKAKHL